MIALTVLVALRLLPVAIAVPVLGGPLAPWSARLALTAMAAMALALVQPPEVGVAVAALPVAALVAIALKELAIGAVLALVVAVPFLAAETAGRWIGFGLGVGGSGGAGPAGPTSSVGLLTSLLAVVVFVGIDGHLVVISALAGSYQALPLLGGLDRAVAIREVSAAVVAFLGAAVALAAPALVASALVDLGIGLVARSGGDLLGGPRGAARGAGALRSAAIVAFLAASLLLLAVAMARGLGAAARSLETVIPALGG